jgi:hypothetical protein
MSHLALCKQYSNKMKHNAAVLQILQQQCFAAAQHRLAGATPTDT